MIDASDKYLSPDDVAERLGVEVTTVRGWIRSGHLPASNVSSGERPTWRVGEADLRAWMLARQAKGAATA